jgi:hypothetical protein
MLVLTLSRDQQQQQQQQRDDSSSSLASGGWQQLGSLGSSGCQVSDSIVNLLLHMLFLFTGPTDN